MHILNNTVLRPANESVPLDPIRGRQPISRAEQAKFSRLQASAISSRIRQNRSLVGAVSIALAGRLKEAI